jgi:hypothetical protein
MEQARKREPLLRSVPFGSLADVVRSGLESSESNALLAAVIRSYQRGPRDIWAAALLEMVAPALLVGVAELQAAIGVSPEDDIGHEFVAEVLDLAAVADEPYLTGWVLKRLIGHARKRVVRTTRSEGTAVLAEGSPDEPCSNESEGQADLVELLADPDARLLWRLKVDRVSVAALAVEEGVSVEAMRWRVRAARSRFLQRNARAAA